MKGYGSIELQEPTKKPLEDDEADDLLLTASRTSRTSIRAYIIHNGPKLLLASLLLTVAAVCFSVTILGNRPSPDVQSGHGLWKQPSQLVNSFLLLGSRKGKNFIRKDNNASKELYHEQIVDHSHPHKSGTFQQRYYENLHYWDGPGHPIFMILGGESPLTQILYPYITEVLAKRFGGVTFNPEHRYFGVSYPKKNASNHDLREQMTPRQAMEDFVHFVHGMQAKLGCGPKGSKDYCPVVTIGGSYPGLLSVLLRINYPDTVDIGYGGGVPFHTWDNSNPEEAAYLYYDYITKIAEQESPGCPAGLRDTQNKTLEEMKALDQKGNLERADLVILAEGYGICPKTVPNSIKSAESLAHKIIGKVPGRFSSENMEYYPPGPDRLFIADCKAFQNMTLTPRERFRNFLIGVAKTDQNSTCYDLGGGDSGPEDPSGKMWNILCCRLAPVMGRSEQSMFYPDKFNPKDDAEYCKKEYGIISDPEATVRDYGFSYEDLKKQSRILLTNGDSDGWRALSYLEDINDSVVVMNFENGAHHSELLHFWSPAKNKDTPDIRKGHEDISELMGIWLHDIKTEGSQKGKNFIRKDNDPLKELYHEQIVDHNHPHKSGTFQQRYFENLHYWDGPGHPIFMILGGEGSLTHILYPYISLALAKHFGGVTFNPEHRYYGKSYPKRNPSNHHLIEQLTPSQAMEDFVHFVHAMQAKLGCGPKGSKDYCPVVTIGGSYPGLLSVLLRINYPDTIDIAYGGGVPFHTWDNSNPEEAAYLYFDYITKIAEQESPGCSEGLKDTQIQTLEEMRALDQMESFKHKDIATLAEGYGICPKTVPKYIKSAESLALKIIGKVPNRYSFTNMDYYPPSPDRLFIRDCMAFENLTATPRERFRNFLIGVAETDQNSTCYDLDGGSDRMWDILCCRLVPVMGRSEQSMFYPSKFDPEEDAEYCKTEFGIVSDPEATVRDYGFSYENLKQQSHILLTNGDNDGWDALSYQEDINDSVVVMNFENGAHHSELLHEWSPRNNEDTPDIRKGHQDIINLMGNWLDEIENE